MTATLNSYIYIVDGYRASHGPVGAHSFFETGLIKDASVNILTETVVLEKPPRLIDINQGGSVMLPVSVNRFYETVIFNRSG